ncbi:MAG TPA: VOC family protein [Arachidicoccus soli]|uniref:Dioxygenase n=1 Tax=Arachidicoccus soli TaxID=2341117 RepID=A0A386HK81_9BACT|nr:VOC family protein [Arachidicoccus soli]AYD46287.1 dioxygenase [Arachidicoccus soli]HEU0226165.1 VOC family protein [Arachidicoccus soli]
MKSFHYAFKVKDIESTRKFYVELLGCQEGRSTKSWLDFNFFGHQLSAHISDDFPVLDYCGKVDGISVPIPHFGCLLAINDFKNIQQKLELANIEFLIQPQIRYKGKTGEQLTMFVFDYSGNPIEFKAFSNMDEVFS